MNDYGLICEHCGCEHCGAEQYHEYDDEGGETEPVALCDDCAYKAGFITPDVDTDYDYTEDKGIGFDGNQGYL
jgi:hypothetical protein